MQPSLGPAAIAAGYRLAAYDTIGSTNAEAMARGRDGDPGRLWVVATEQTAGEGRRGRRWHTPPGNLAASALIVTTASRARAATLGFVGGLALEAALRRVAPALPVRIAMDGGGDRCVRFTLKWPNDVLADGAKIAGILVQAAPRGRDALAVVVGIGVNVRTPPAGLDHPATSLAALGCRADAAELFTALAEAFVDAERLWDGGHGIEAVRALWLDHASGLGEPVAVRGAEGVLRGIFETIDADGRLVIRAADGRRLTVAAGEVHFGATASLSAGSPAL